MSKNACLSISACFPTERDAIAVAERGMKSFSYEFGEGSLFRKVQLILISKHIASGEEMDSPLSFYDPFFHVCSMMLAMLIIVMCYRTKKTEGGLGLSGRILLTVSFRSQFDMEVVRLIVILCFEFNLLLKVFRVLTWRPLLRVVISDDTSNVHHVLTGDDKRDSDETSSETRKADLAILQEVEKNRDGNTTYENFGPEDVVADGMNNAKRVEEQKTQCTDETIMVEPKKKR
ncbi:hypothetical protein KIN20_008636 [Parelaphostrongylus tenuis]|uniref:Uncharacterized protein n=1 Tax=Parelaphostrongylus tenuis TaxID=148309 RepID=A0AAD5MRD4_PARTN|nr:hypothetical protein KIN20_008636 [Parelaphostrongylus tenuis]